MSVHYELTKTHLFLNKISNYEPALIEKIYYYIHTYKFKDTKELKNAVSEFKINKTDALVKYGNPRYWDVSQITDMSYLLYNILDRFNYDISLWDTSNVKNMNSMFSFNSGLIEYNISNWDVSNVTTMESMFERCYYFNFDISQWDVSSVTTMERMFIIENH